MKKKTAREIVHPFFAQDYCLPVLDDDGDLVFISHSHQCEIMTIEIEQLVQEAFNEGHKAGYDECYEMYELGDI